jgi:hypothetical protein
MDRITVDGVFPDATAINSRAIAHLDLAQTNRPDLVQRMVYARRDLRKELRDLPGARYSRERVKEEIHLAGQSGRELPI